MSNKENKATKAQGAEVVTDGNVSRETKKQQAKSVSYALKAVKGHIKTLAEAGLIPDGQKDAIDNAIKLATSIYVKSEYEI